MLSRSGGTGSIRSDYSWPAQTTQIYRESTRAVPPSRNRPKRPPILAARVRLLLLRLASVGCAASLAFAGVLAWAATALASALALTLVFTFARVFGKGLLGVSHRVEGDT